MHKKIKFSIQDFVSKCDQIRRNLRVWSHLLKKSLMENSIFCAVEQYQSQSYVFTLMENSARVIAQDMKAYSSF